MRPCRLYAITRRNLSDELPRAPCPQKPDAQAGEACAADSRGRHRNAPRYGPALPRARTAASGQRGTTAITNSVAAIENEPRLALARSVIPPNGPAIREDVIGLVDRAHHGSG